MDMKRELQGRFIRMGCALLAVLGLAALAAGASDEVAGQAFRQRFSSQLAALAQEKAGRTSTQKKMGSQLVYVVRQRQGTLSTEVSSLRP